ncbi:MAG: hypothetical protein F6J89_21120 [Symploca sp. SIO1C4]|uniref:Surface-adhesin protein E-like domain-containing protein n=1 Tax=Symploca sp. SIO1C4 TaxID=2607765 RepID=A0A6B3NAC5_9CYAN|nr:hypothetical protein [Symploca sp. SIO1C4]
MLKTLFLTGFTTILVTLPAAAENWVLVGIGQGEIQHYIDTESVRSSNGSFLLWRMSVLPKSDEKGILATKSYIYMICPLRAWQRRAYAHFNAQGKLLSREELGENQPLQFFTSGSVGEGLWKFVCD